LRQGTSLPSYQMKPSRSAMDMECLRECGNEWGGMMRAQQQQHQRRALPCDQADRHRIAAGERRF